METKRSAMAGDEAEDGDKCPPLLHTCLPPIPAIYSPITVGHENSTLLNFR